MWETKKKSLKNIHLNIASVRQEFINEFQNNL